MKLHTALTLFILIFTQCKSNTLPQVSQGLKGQVLWFEGNLMPGPGVPLNNGKPIIREVFIYELTNMQQLTMEGNMCTNVKTKLVATTKSDSKGEFEIALAPGEYSVFIKEESGLFANTFDGNRNIGKVQILSGEYTTVKLKVDYKAAY